MLHPQISLKKAMLGACLAPLFIFIVKFSFYTVMPFSWFVDIEKFHVQDTQQGTPITIDMMRYARFDIRGSATKEIYRAENNATTQTSHTNYKKSFIYEQVNNNIELGLEVIFSDRPIPKGEYIIVDYVEIYPMMGITKTQTITTNKFKIY